MSTRPVRLTVPLLVVTLLVGISVPVTAEHVQNDNGSRAVAFDHRAGNEWWVEVAISGPDAFTAIGVFAHDGAGSNLYGLEKKPWGTWGGSFHIEPGHDVQFKALWTNGATQESCWFTHPAGVESCGTTPPPPPPPGPFDATFTGVRGNEWWIQGQAAARPGYSVGEVDVRLAGGAWQPLAKQSWGGWAASYHAVQGTIVQLRATATNGETDLSSCRQWIPAANQDAAIVSCELGPPPPPPPPPSGFDATFSNVKGNQWWVEARVTANEPLQGVEARLHCTSAWKAMTLRSWGSWAASFHIPSGSKVDFRATSTSGSHDFSGGYIWPEATPTPACPAPVSWPQPGSFATYDLGHSVSGGGENWKVTARLHLVFANGAWNGLCTARNTHRALDGSETSEDWTAEVHGQPPMTMPAATSVGATHDLGYFFPSYAQRTCDRSTDSSGFPLYVQGQENRVTNLKDANGQPRIVHAWYGNDNDVQGIENRAGAWDTKLGLVLDWDRSGRMSGMGTFGGDLVATDAPLAPAAPVPPPPPAGVEWYTESFWGMKGNEWWAEIRVDSPVSGVDARTSGGEWHALSLREWGAWAGSFHIPAGSLVQFRAHRTDGAYGFHAQGFPWPDGTPPYPGWGNCGTAFDGAFHNVKGNADYQQVNVYATCNLDGVEVRIYDGPWTPMRRQAWGDWASALHISTGDRVQFRALGGGGQESSQPVAWPPA